MRKFANPDKLFAKRTFEYNEYFAGKRFQINHLNFLRLLYHIFLAKVLEIYEAKLPAGLLYDVTCLSMRGIWPLWPILWYFLPFLRILLWHTPTMGQPAQTWDWQRPPPRDNSLIILMSDIFSLADKKSADNRSRVPLMFTFITFIIHVFHQRREKPETD